MNQRELAEEFARIVKSLNKSATVTNLNRYAKGEMLVLNYLYRHSDEQIMPGSISSYTETSTARVARILGSLEERGYVTREIDRLDRRKILVAITEKGKQYAHDQHNNLIRHVAAVFGQMGEHTSRQFIHGLKSFIEASKHILEERDNDIST